MRQAAILTIVLGMFFSQVALAGDMPKDYDPAETRCLDGNDAAIERMLSMIDYVDKELPSVPPEEQRYLDTEFARALKLENDEMLNKEVSQNGKRLLHELSLRPSYDVWYLRRELEPSKKYLKHIINLRPDPDTWGIFATTYNKNLDAEKLERASYAIYPVSEFTKELSHYYDKKRASLTSEENNSFLAASGMNVELGYFISCKLAKIMGRQKFN